MTRSARLPELARQAFRADDQDEPDAETDEEHPAEHEVADDEGVLDRRRDGSPPRRRRRTMPAMNISPNRLSWSKIP